MPCLKAKRPLWLSLLIREPNWDHKSGRILSGPGIQLLMAFIQHNGVILRILGLCGSNSLRYVRKIHQIIHHPNRFPQDHQWQNDSFLLSPRVWSFNCDNSSRNIKACDHKEPRPMALKAWEKCGYKGGENGCLGLSNNAKIWASSLVFNRNHFLSKNLLSLSAS